MLGAFFLTYALGQVPAGWLNDRFGSRLMDMPEAHTWFAEGAKNYLLNLNGAEKEALFKIYDPDAIPPLVLPPDFVLPPWAYKAIGEGKPVYVFDFWEFKPGRCVIWKTLNRLSLWFRSVPPPLINHASLSFDDAVLKANGWADERGVE